MDTHQRQIALEPLLSVRAVAKLFDAHPETLLRLARTGQLPGIKVGKLCRFRVSELDSWVAKGIAAEKSQVR
jgi:excisionase family DNA binding protein